METLIAEVLTFGRRIDSRLSARLVADEFNVSESTAHAALETLELDGRLAQPYPGMWEEVVRPDAL